MSSTYHPLSGIVRNQFRAIEWFTKTRRHQVMIVSKVERDTPEAGIVDAPGAVRSASVRVFLTPGELRAFQAQAGKRGLRHIQDWLRLLAIDVINKTNPNTLG
jgi:hypothetical protein